MTTQNKITQSLNQCHIIMTQREARGAECMHTTTTKRLLYAAQVEKRSCKRTALVLLKHKEPCIYSQHPVTRTLRGMKNPFEIANVRVNGWPPFNVTKLYFTQFVEAEQKLSHVCSMLFYLYISMHSNSTILVYYLSISYEI